MIQHFTCNSQLDPGACWGPVGVERGDVVGWLGWAGLPLCRQLRRGSVDVALSPAVSGVNSSLAQQGRRALPPTPPPSPSPPPLLSPLFPANHSRTLSMDAPLPDYYRTLGVEARASASEIKEAYKRRSLKTHPDRFPNATPAERQRYTQKFQTLADAYYVLSDTQRRREYDELRSSRPSSNSYFGSGVDSDDDEAASEYSEKEQSHSANFFQSFFPAPSSRKRAKKSRATTPATTHAGVAASLQPTASLPTYLRSCCDPRCTAWRLFGSTLEEPLERRLDSSWATSPVRWQERLQAASWDASATPRARVWPRCLWAWVQASERKY